jgi:MFS family permease
LTVSVPYLFFALVLLWLPRQWLRAGGHVLPSRRRYRSAIRDSSPHHQRQPDDRSIWLREELVKGRNYFDLLRGSIGSWSVVNFCFFLPPGADAASSGRWTLFALQAVIFVVAVLIQMIRWYGRISLFAPIFFLMGLTVGVCGWQVALFAGVLVWALNSALPNPEAFLFVQTIALAGFSALFLGTITAMTLLGAALVFLPVVVSLLTKEQLMLKTRRPRPAESGSHA